MNTTLIVDGYNVIHSWPELSRMKEENLAHARDKLREFMAGYGAFKGVQVVLVFDAHMSAASEASEIQDGVVVVYTGEGQTADSYIEKLAYGLVRQRQTVYVVTSDWAEQLTVLGTGAFRISSRELYRDCMAHLEQLTREYAENILTYHRNEVSTRLSADVMKKLDKMRRT